MPHVMPKSAARRPYSLLTGIARFLPAFLVFGAVVPAVHPLALILLLAGDALLLTALCANLGFDMDTRFARSVARRGLTAFVLLSLYSVFVTALIAVPVWFLATDPSLVAMCGLSIAILIALVAVRRVWPAFVLPFIWDDAYPEEGQGSWLFTALRRSFAFARHLLSEHGSYFTHGLPASLGLLAIVLGALGLAGLGDRMLAENRLIAIAVYALVLAPLALLIFVKRCSSLLLADERAISRKSVRNDSVAVEASPLPSLPAGMGALELSTTLLAAARTGQIELALAALHRGANPDTMPMPGDRDQRSVLTHAVILPDLRLLRALIGKGVDVNRMHGGMAALIAATRDSYQGRPDAIMTLLANGADPRSADSEGNTALHHAALCGEPIVAALLIDAAADINAINRDAMTPLGVACANGNWTLATFLLERGAQTEVERAQPALLLAATVTDDDPTGVKLLLKRRAKVDAPGLLSRTALMTAALAGHARIAEALLSAGANASLIDQHGTSALMEAARGGAVAIIHALGKRKANADLIDATGRTALMIACNSRLSSEDTVRALMALGADRNIAGGDGKRALDYAAASGRWHIVALLDPGYPLPSSLAVAPSTNEVASATHLLDALRFAHWNVADEFRPMLRDWPEAELAALYLGLVDAEHARARDWVAHLGLSPDARLAEGRTLTEVLFAGLPTTHVAFLQHLRRGAPVGGAALVARALDTVAAGTDSAPIIAVVHELIERGADCCGQLPGEISALHLAAALGANTVVERLLERGADPNVRDARGRMPLHFALKASSARAVAVARALIRYGADPERASASGETALGLALARGDRDLVYWLNWQRWRLPRRPIVPADLPGAAAGGDIDAVEKLLAYGLPIDSVDAQGASALIRAAGSGYAALVVRLLDAGANPKLPAQSGATCLSAAVAARRESVVRTLLQHAIDPDQRLPGGGTALMIAAALGLPRLAAPLLENGADPNAADERGNTALQAAAQFAFGSRDTEAACELFTLLLDAGADRSACNQTGQDALLLLLGARADPGAPCEARHLGEVAKVLLDRGAAVDTQDQRGVSALHACAMHGLLGVARLLKSRNAPLDLHDGLGRTAGEIAALLGYTDVANELGVVRPPPPGVRQTLRKRAVE